MHETQLSYGHLSNAHAHGTEECQSNANHRLDQITIRVVLDGEQLKSSLAQVLPGRRGRRVIVRGQVDVKEILQIAFDAEQERGPHDEQHAAYGEQESDQMADGELLLEEDAREERRDDHARVGQRLHVRDVQVLDREVGRDHGCAAYHAAQDEQLAMLWRAEHVELVEPDEDQHYHQLYAVSLSQIINYFNFIVSNSLCN